MTNSPNNVTKKSKGPIRTEAIVPAVCFVVLIVLYYIFLFDWHLRSGLEWIGTQANGAEVNIGSLDTSIVKASFEMKRIEVTDPGNPVKNRIELGRVNTKLLWDALLRAKFVVTEAGITDVEVGTARKYPGEVLPPGENTFLQKAKAKVAGAVLTEVSELLTGFNPSEHLTDLKNLKSLERVEKLKTELTTKQTQWTKVVDSLPGDKDFNTLQANISTVQSSSSNPADAAKKISQLTTYVKESESKLDSVKVNGAGLLNDVNSFGTQISEIDELAKQDRADVEKLVKLPSLDSKNIAAQLFGSSVLDNFGKAQNYVVMARQYMPPKKKLKQEDQGLISKKRSKGRNYEFGRPKSYPQFWLQRAAINSTGANSAFGGDVKGSVIDLTSNPPIVGRPAVFELRADFPKQELRSIEASLIIDHTKDDSIETLKASVGSYPVKERVISNSEKLKFGFLNSRGSGKIEGTLRGEKLSLSIRNYLKNVSYNIKADSKLVEGTLQSITKGLSTVSVEARLTGNWKDPDISVSSNLADALQNGFSAQLRAKLEEARRQIDAMIQAKIGKQKVELTKQFNDTKGQITSQIEHRVKKADAAKAQALAGIESAKKQTAPAVNKLKKKLKF